MKNILIFIFGFLLFMPISCQNKKNDKKMEEEKFLWEEQTSCPIGYPVEVYKGGIAFKSLTNGVCTGVANWGTVSHGMSNTKDWMPRFLKVTWLSYAEDSMYTIETPIDHKKLFSLFKNGYQTKSANGSGKVRNETYTGICTGFAPGGVVIVWAVGPGRQTEIGKYQGTKTEIPQSEIATLDSHKSLMFKPEYRKMTMNDDRIVPKKIQEANKNKPIPFGLWETYRKKYQWKINFILPKGVVLNPKSTCDLSFLNGEKLQIFNEDFPQVQFSSNPIPRSFYFSWKAENGKFYVGNCTLNEDSVLKVFKEVYGDKSTDFNAEIELRPNIANTFFTISLKGANGKESFIKTDNLEVFQATIFK